jgi:hypothetical protein
LNNYAALQVLTTISRAVVEKVIIVYAQLVKKLTAFYYRDDVVVLGFDST